jgi:hypothetical protein
MADDTKTFTYQFRSVVDLCLGLWLIYVSSAAALWNIDTHGVALQMKVTHVVNAGECLSALSWQSRFAMSLPDQRAKGRAEPALA